LAEAKEYDAAAETLRLAVAAGASDGPVWLTWGAATAATGDVPPRAPY
jgi:hypothetical protein